MPEETNTTDTTVDTTVETSVGAVEEKETYKPRAVIKAKNANEKKYPEQKLHPTMNGRDVAKQALK